VLRTALHWAVKRNHADVVKYLLEIGASNDVFNAENKRPSDFAKDISVKRLFNG
jgi:ankyrin repeat protein